MTKNMANMDRIARLVFAMVMVFVIAMGFIEGPMAWVLGALAAVLERQGSAMRFDQTLRLRETQSRLPAGGLGAEKRIKRVSQHVRRQAGAVIRDVDTQSAIRRRDLNPNFNMR